MAVVSVCGSTNRKAFKSAQNSKKLMKEEASLLTQSQFKIPDSCPLAGIPLKELAKEYGVTFQHTHNPHPSLKTKKSCNGKVLETEKYIAVIGTIKNIDNFILNVFKN